MDQRFEDIHVFHYPTHAVVWHVIAATEVNTWAEELAVPSPAGYRWQLIFCSILLTDAAADSRALAAYEDSCKAASAFGDPATRITLYVDATAIREYTPQPPAEDS